MNILIALAALAAAQVSPGVHWKPLSPPTPPRAAVQPSAPAVVTRPGSELLTNQTVISLVNAGLGPEAIEAKIAASRGSFDTSTNALIALKQAGVPDSVIAAMLKRGSSSVSANAMADNSNPDPLIPHAAGIYILDARSSGRMVRIDPTVSNQLKTSNLWGYAFSYGLSSLKMKTVISNASARVRASSRRPVFYFFFNQASPLAPIGEFSTAFSFTATSPSEFSLIRFDQKKDRREASVMSVGISGMKSGINDKARVAFSYDDVAPGVFKVTPSTELPPGEYGFLYSIGAQAGSTARIFDFSVL